MSILVTGAFGFVGSNLSKAFKENNSDHLIAVDLNEPATHLFDEFYSWDQLEKYDPKNFGTIIHLAGKAHDTSSTAETQAYFDINVGLTKKIFDFFLASAATKFIFFSSIKAVADTVNEKVLTEESDCNPMTPYGQSKLAAEKYILESILPPGKKVYILRPCMIHGPGNKGNLSLLYKLAQKALPWPLGAFENNRSFTSIQNLQYVLMKLVDEEIAPGVYQMADDEPLSTNDLIYLIAASLNRKARIWNVSPVIIKYIAKAGDWLKLPLNSERLKKLTESYIVSNQKIKNALGVEKMPYTAREGMNMTLASFE